MTTNPNQPDTTEDVGDDMIRSSDKDDKDILDQESATTTILPKWYKEKFKDFNDSFEKESATTADKIKEYNAKINKLKTMSDKELEAIHRQFEDAISYTSEKRRNHEK